MNTIEIIFSPTGGTEKVVDIIANSWKQNIIRIDLSNPDADFEECKINSDDHVLIGMPSFSGRAPAVAIERLKKIKGHNASTTIISVYGNRAYEDTLVEMEDAAKEAGFKVVGGVAAVAQHSIIEEYAANRPDTSDISQLKEFAKQLENKNDPVSYIPGNRPYKKAGGGGLVPKVTDECSKCGMCARNCPVKAINELTYKTDASKCISCMRCVKECSYNARKVNGVMVSMAALAIKKSCSVRKDNEIFL